MADELNAMRRRLSALELEQIKTTGKLTTLGGFTLGSILASLNEVGIGPEDVEVLGAGDGGAIELWWFGGPFALTEEESDV